MNVRAGQEPTLKRVFPHVLTQLSRRLFITLFFACCALLIGFFPFNVVNWESSFARGVYAQDAPLDLSDLEEREMSDRSREPSILQDSATSSSTDKNASFIPSERTRLLDLLLAGSWIGAILLLGSIIAVSLIIKLCLMLRRSSFMPIQLERDLSTMMSNNAYERALKTAEGNNSFLARIVRAGLKEADQEWRIVEKAIEDEIAYESAALQRRTEPLSLIGNVAPMLGLLGTVLGMVTTFGELAIADAGGRNLANGIYFALVTTVDGLLVAIPILVAHSLLNIRIAKIISETAKKVDNLFTPLKRQKNPTLFELSKNGAKILNENNLPANARSALALRTRGLREVKEEDRQSASVPSQPTQPRPNLSLKDRQKE